MIHSRKAESFVWIVVWVFILSFVILGIVNLIIFSYRLTDTYEENNTIQILKNNLTHIVQTTDTSAVKENEIFFVYKNPATQNFEILSGAGNAEYRYIDKLGNTILDPENFPDDVFIHGLWLTTEDITLLEKNQIIKASVKRLAKK